VPLRGVYVPHFDQISVKFLVLGVLYPQRCTDGGEIWYGGGDGPLRGEKPQTRLLSKLNTVTVIVCISKRITDYPDYPGVRSQNCGVIVCISKRITGTCGKLAQTQIRNISSSIITVTRFQLHIHITSTTRTRRLNLSRNYTTFNVT